ncbi:Na+/H+ antiporter NhaC family protein [Anaerovoracaceae bacterium 42-11]|nr:AbgT family transporter [Emergencia sp.]
MKKRIQSIFKKVCNANAYVILCCMIMLSAVATWLMPAGEYNRYIDEATGRMLIEPSSFHYIDANPLSFFEILKSIPEGIIGSAEIIMFIFVVSGTIQVVRGTGALDAGLRLIVLKLKGKDAYILCIVSIVCSLMGSIFGFAQEIIPLIPLGVVLAESMGYDRIVGFDIIRTSLWVGFAASTLNPFVIGIAHNLSGLPMFSGISFRIICYILFITVTLIYILRYAKKVKKNPESSLVFGYKHGDENNECFAIADVSITRNQIIVLALLCVNFIVMVAGTVIVGWGTTELAALFLGFAVVSGFAGKLNANRIAEEFTKGLSSIAFGAIVVGFARAIVLIMEKGQILDTIVFLLSKNVVEAGDSISLIGMFLIQSIINFFIGSATGQAAVTMPIMIPLADSLEVTRQGAVLAYQFGAGITDMIYPAMIYYLPFAQIPYNLWVKHIYKLVIILTVISMIMLAVAGLIGYGPF